MTVEIQNQLNLLFFFYFFYQSFDCMNFRVEFGICFFPTPIEIETCEVSSVVPQRNSVNVDHRDNIKVVSPRQKLIFTRIFQQLQDNLFTNVGPNSLSRVLSCKDNNDFLLEVPSIMRFDSDERHWFSHGRNSKGLKSDFIIVFDFF